LLFFLVSPAIAEHPMSTIYLLSPAPVILNCSVDALPLPVITWIRTPKEGNSRIFNSSSVLDDGRNLALSTTTISPTSVTSTFRVETTVATDSSTNYTCIATNRLGSDLSREFVVSVYGK